MDRSELRVLLVDDDEEECLLVRRFLSNARTGPIRVVWAPSYDIALNEVRSASHDVCLLDYQLGEKTGIELLQEIRALGHDLPVILLTGHGSLELDLTAMELGAFDYLEKNALTPALLERSIRYTVADHRARTGLQRTNEDLERRVQERTAELDRSNRELEQFARMVASDMREPLQALAGQVEALRDEMEKPGASAQTNRASLDSVLHTIRNVELLVRSVLDYAQVGRGSRPLQSVSLEEALRDACLQLENALAECGVKIESVDLPTVQGDPELIRGLFRNLLDNAIKFRGTQSPAVDVRAEPKGGMWLISFRDNGIGMDPEEAADVFLMFRHGSTHAGHAGIGMGLAMCRKIVQYHGGRIWADTEPGRGSTFFFTFPIEGHEEAEGAE